MNSGSFVVKRKTNHREGKSFSSIKTRGIIQAGNIEVVSGN